MNNFQDSPLNKEEEPEESSWTFYFEELTWQNDQEMIMSCNENSNSFVSDAASSVIVKKSACIEDDQAKKLRSKKRKTMEVMLDDSLEDTASSPLSSPKVSFHAFIAFFILCTIL